MRCITHIYRYARACVGNLKICDRNYLPQYCHNCFFFLRQKVNGTPGGLAWLIDFYHNKTHLKKIIRNRTFMTQTFYTPIYVHAYIYSR